MNKFLLAAALALTFQAHAETTAERWYRLKAYCLRQPKAVQGDCLEAARTNVDQLRAEQERERAEQERERAEARRLEAPRRAGFR